MGWKNLWRGERALKVREASVPPGVLPPSRSAITATPSQAMSLSAVFRAVTLLSTGVSQMSVDCWRGSEQVAAPLFVRQPDAKLSRSAFLAETTNCLALRGNAYWRVVRDSSADSPQALIVLNPDEVQPFEDGTFGYRGATLQPWQVSHLMINRFPGSVQGYGPLQAARVEIEGQLRLRDYSSEWFDRNSTPSGILSVANELSVEEADSIKARWETIHQGTDGVAVMGQGTTYQPIWLKPADAQFVESQQLGVTQIARLFGVPAHLLLASVEGSSRTYSNMADADLSFVRWTLMQYLREIEEAFSSLLPRGQSARFNLDAILRQSTKDRYEAHKIALDAKFLTINEVRAIEGLNPLEDSQGGEDDKT